MGILRYEDELVTYEKLGVENHVCNLISELCNRSEAQQRFRLGKGVSFESHTNSFEAGARDDPSQPPRPDRFCIHHKLDGSSDQKCLLGLQHNDILDQNCPNVALHTQGRSSKHQITAPDFLRQLNQQLDTDIDQHCTPLNKCGSYGAFFKITCAVYGYTVVGKGTTTHLWP